MEQEYLKYIRGQQLSSKRVYLPKPVGLFCAGPPEKLSSQRPRLFPEPVVTAEPEPEGPMVYSAPPPNAV